MIQYRKILEMAQEGLSLRTVSASTGHGRPKVTEILQLAKEKGLECPLTEEMDDHWIEEFLYPYKAIENSGYGMIDFALVHRELAKPNVTLSLLHYEYEVSCRANGKIPYTYRSFLRHYKAYADKYKATLRVRRKPGEIMEVDWAGSTAFIVDRDTGEKVKTYVFVATLPCSQLSYAEATLSMDLNAWIGAHNRAFEYFGGSTQIVVPDNLKTSVTRHTLKELVLNPTYREMCDHYGTLCMPARVRAPRDKASVEGSVSTISTWIIAALRNEHCFTLTDLNQKISLKLEEFNHRDFSKKKGTRFTAFEEEEKFALSPLPAKPYKMAEWRTAKVRLDYHISIGNMFYSVPYEYIGKNVDVRVSEHLIEVFFKQMRVATHSRLYGKFGQLSTSKDHMPDNHKLYVEQTPENALQWAETIGENTLRLIQYLLDTYQVERKALSSIFSLKNSSRRYTKYEIERACKEILNVTQRPTVKLVQNQLKANKKKDAEQALEKPSKSQDDFGFTRGSDYWGGKGQ